MQQCVDVEMTHGFLTVKNPYNLLSEIFVSAGMCEWILAMCYEETFTNVSSVLYKCPVLPNGIGKAMKEFHLWDAKVLFCASQGPPGLEDCFESQDELQILVWA